MPTDDLVDLINEIKNWHNNVQELKGAESGRNCRLSKVTQKLLEEIESERESIRGPEELDTYGFF